MNALSRSAREAALIETAHRVLPAGSFGNVPFDLVLERGQAGRVWDVSGNEYVDLLLGSGPMFVGHCHPEVTEVVREQLGRGTTFFASSAPGIRLAAAIVDAMPCAEMVRYVSSGTEADAYAMRLARAFTGREKILKFEGGYHGMSDWSLMSLAPKRPGNFPRAIPDSPGIPRAVAEEMLIAPFNDADAAVALIEEHRNELAGVILEPFQRLIAPKPGFLQALRQATEKHGIPLIFDEVVCGFRFAAIAGRADIMRLFDKGAVGEDKFLFQVGTLSGNPIAAAAGLKCLEILRRPGAYEHVFRIGTAMMEGIGAMLREAGLKAQVIGAPVMFDVIFATGDIADYRATLRNDAAVSKRFNDAVRANGVLKSDGKSYVGLCHTDADVADVLRAFRAGVEAVS